MDKILNTCYVYISDIRVIRSTWGLFCYILIMFCTHLWCMLYRVLFYIFRSPCWPYIGSIHTILHVTLVLYWCDIQAIYRLTFPSSGSTCCLFKMWYWCYISIYRLTFSSHAVRLVLSWRAGLLFVHPEEEEDVCELFALLLTQLPDSSHYPSLRLIGSLCPPPTSFRESLLSSTAGHLNS